MAEKRAGESSRAGATQYAAVGGDVPLLDRSWRRVEEFREDRPWMETRRDAYQMRNEEGTNNDHDNDDEWEYEETEELVTLDLGPDSRRLAQMSHEYSITGLETEHPFLRIGNLLFKGKWDELLGTEIFLKIDRDQTKPKNEQTILRPFEKTQKDSLEGRIPGVTNRRIIFEPAVNLREREENLLRPIVEAAGTDVSEGTTKEKTGIIAYKDWRWVRGKGWMRREEVVGMDSEQKGEFQDVEEDEGIAEEEELDDDQQQQQRRRRRSSAEEEASSIGQAVAQQTKGGRPRRKRGPMTEMEKAKARLTRTLKRMDRDNPEFREELAKNKEEWQRKNAEEGKVNMREGDGNHREQASSRSQIVSPSNQDGQMDLS